MAAKTFVRLGVAFATATLVTAVAGSIVQTQANVAAIEALGHPVPAALRFAVTAEDVMRFGPVMAAIAGGAFLIALPAALFTSKALQAPAWLACAVAGAVGLWAAFSVMGYFTPMPTLVAAARGAIGLAALCATGALGGLAFALLARRV